MFVSWRDPQRPIWGDDWPYQLQRTLGTPASSGIPPGQRIPIELDDPQRPIWGVTWQYGYRIVSQGPAASTGGPATPPPGAPWGSTGAAAPELEDYGYYEPWPVQRSAQIASIITAPFVPAGPPPQSYAGFYALRASWTEIDWRPPQTVTIVTLQPPPPATNPTPRSTLPLLLTRLSWEEPYWPAQRTLFNPNIGVVTVPSVVGLSQSTALTVLANAELIGIVTSLAYSSVIAKGSVILQSPAAGSQVNAGSVVNLQLSAGIQTAPQTPFPKVSYRTFSWLEMVEQAWGSAYREPDHRIYVFSDGRAFDSTDMYQTGIYRKPS